MRRRVNRTHSSHRYVVCFPSDSRLLFSRAPVVHTAQTIDPSNSSFFSPSTPLQVHEKNELIFFLSTSGSLAEFNELLFRSSWLRNEVIAATLADVTRKRFHLLPNECLLLLFFVGFLLLLKYIKFGPSRRLTPIKKINRLFLALSLSLSLILCFFRSREFSFLTAHHLRLTLALEKAPPP